MMHFLITELTLSETKDMQSGISFWREVRLNDDGCLQQRSAIESFDVTSLYNNVKVNAAVQAVAEMCTFTCLLWSHLA